MKEMYLQSEDTNEDSLILKVDKIKKIIIDSELIEYDPFLGIVQLSDLNKSDYAAMNDTYLSSKVFEIILL